MNNTSEEQYTNTEGKFTIWDIILKFILWCFKLFFTLIIAIFEGIFAINKEKKTDVGKKSKPKKKGKMTAYDILLARGYSEKQATAAIRNCQRDLEMAMDDGAMEELEDIVVEDLGVDYSHVEELI